MRGADVRKARKRLGLKQTEFAELVGVHPISVSRWERDEVRVTTQTENLISLLLTRRRAKGRRRS